MSKKFIFITVKEVKKGDLKFRFLPGQVDLKGTTLNPKLNIKVMNGKSMRSYAKDAIYALEDNKTYKKYSDCGSYYSVSKYRLMDINGFLKDPSTVKSDYYREVVDAYNEFKAKMISEAVDDFSSGTKEGTATEASTETPVEKEPTFYDNLKTEFLKSKPSISADGFFMEDSDWMILIRNIKHHINTLITGPTGSGKTTAIKLACEKLGIPCSVYDMGSMFDPISSLLGVHRLEGGSSKFDYAKFAQDIQKPGVILLDELSRAPIQSNNILFPCLDDRRTLPVEIAGCKDLRTITVHPEVCFIATANIGAEYTGTNIMDRALQNRFFPVELNYLDKNHESKVLQQRCGVEKTDADLIVRVATEIRNIYKKQELSISVSTRETLMVANLVKDGWSIKDALSMVFLPLFEGTNDPKEESTERGKIRKLLMTY